MNNERFLWSAADNLGIAGNTTTQMAARLSDITARQAAGASICFFMGGTNDLVTKVPASTITANYTTILNHITQTLGMIAIVRPILSRGNWSTLTAPEIVTAKADMQTCNAFLQSYCASNAKAYYQSQLYAAWDDGTGQPKSGLTADQVHPDIPGALLLGQHNAAALSSYGEGKLYPATHTNLLLNSTLSGSGGSGAPANLTVTGNKPTSWVLAGTLTGTNSLTFGSAAEGIMLTLTTSGGGTTDYVQLSQQVNASGNYTASDVIQALANVQFISGSNVNSVFLRITDTASGTVIYSGYEKGSTANFPMSTMGQGLIGTARFNPGTSPVSITFAIRIEVNSTTSASAVINLRSCGLFKIA